MMGDFNPRSNGGFKAVLDLNNAINPVAMVGGLGDLAAGPGTIAVGNSIAIGYGAKAIGVNAICISPTSTRVQGSNAIAIGAGANVSLGTSSGIAIGTSATVANANGIAIGNGAVANSNNSISLLCGNSSSSVQGSLTIGPTAKSDFNGQMTFSNGNFSSGTGDAEIAFTQMYMLTTNATPTELKTGTASTTTTPTGVLVLTNNSTYIFNVDIVARVSAAGTDYSAWNLTFAITREAAAANTAIFGTPVTTLIGQTAGATAWAVGVTADTTNGRPTISVTGAASTNIRWVANVRMTKVSG